MGWMMFLRNDPTFLLRDVIVFSALAVIIAVGYIYIRKNYTILPSR
jgi:NADH:ubiquinone oxidoreductase subunit F (NADH-binding)